MGCELNQLKVITQTHLQKVKQVIVKPLKPRLFEPQRDNMLYRPNVAAASNANVIPRPSCNSNGFTIKSNPTIDKLNEIVVIRVIFLSKKQEQKNSKQRITAKEHCHSGCFCLFYCQLKKVILTITQIKPVTAKSRPSFQTICRFC